MTSETGYTGTGPGRKGRKLPLSAKIFLFLFAALLLCRIGYDLSLYFFGGTIAVRSEEAYEYLVRFPRGYTDFGGPRPLLVFLHGAGEMGRDVQWLKEVDPFHFAFGKVPAEELPFILVAPVVPKGEHSWDPAKVKAMVDSVLRHPGRLKIDARRIYLTGFSMGGSGTFETAEEFPDFFAAIAPLAGSSETIRAGRLKNLPIRAFHGDADETVPYRASAEMIAAVKEAGGRDAELVTLPGKGHQICSDVYGRPEIYRWLLENEK